MRVFSIRLAPNGLHSMNEWLSISASTRKLKKPFGLGHSTGGVYEGALNRNSGSGLKCDEPSRPSGVQTRRPGGDRGALLPGVGGGATEECWKDGAAQWTQRTDG